MEGREGRGGKGALTLEYGIPVGELNAGNKRFPNSVAILRSSPLYPFFNFAECSTDIICADNKPPKPKLNIFL